MKNKLTVLLALIILVFPSISFARFQIQTANITMIVSTQGQDSPFVFDLSDGEQFNLQTQNLTASKTVSVAVFGQQYILSQESVQGLNVEGVNCVSDNSNDVFSYTSNDAIFSPIANENITCTFDDVVPKTPVLIVPGLLGSELEDGNDVLWLDLNRVLTNADESFMDYLAFNINL